MKESKRVNNDEEDAWVMKFIAHKKNASRIICWFCETGMKEWKVIELHAIRVNWSLNILIIYRIQYTKYHESRLCLSIDTHFQNIKTGTGNVIKALTCDEKASAYATRSIKPDI